MHSVSWARNLFLHLDSVGYILVGIIVICVFQLVHLVVEYHSKGNWIRVNAVVMEVKPETIGQSGPPGKMPLLQVDAGKVQYKYWVEGTSYSGFGLSSRDRSVTYSRPLIVLYNPKNPAQSVIDTGTPWGLILVYGIGIIAALLTLAAWQFLHIQSQNRYHSRIR